MDLQRFENLMNIAGGRLNQSALEWRYFLEFVDSYFKTRNILNPVVVEIGIEGNAQKQFYRELLGAEHIGIDIASHTIPDILGDSHSPSTVELLRSRLAGRPINLLFIDGNHSYDGVRSDYEIYAPITKHIVALHDIAGVSFYPGECDVMRFWQELLTIGGSHAFIAIQHYSFRQRAIGLIIKESA